MKIKRLDGSVTEILLSRDELERLGVRAAELTLLLPRARALLLDLLTLVEQLCGGGRDGHVTFVECRPYINGNCRLCVGFTRQPSRRRYSFASADDLLDAFRQLRQLRRNDASASSPFRIERTGGQFSLTLPPADPDDPAVQHDLAILSEYASFQ